MLDFCVDEKHENLGPKKKCTRVPPTATPYEYWILDSYFVVVVYFGYIGYGIEDTHTRQNLIHDETILFHW